jgi:hypothetical protein
VQEGINRVKEVGTKYIYNIFGNKPNVPIMLRQQREYYKVEKDPLW